MSNKLLTATIMKVGFIACLFFCSTTATAQDWKFQETAQTSYNLLMKLQVSEMAEVLQQPASVEQLYIQSLSEALELLLTEDAAKFGLYEERHQQRLQLRVTGTDAQQQFLQAESRLQWAFVYLKFGHELDAALNLRQAFLIADRCRTQYPNFVPIRKTTGFLEIIIGSVPEKYTWVLDIMGMSGNIQDGLAELEMVRKSSSSLALEADLLHSMVYAFILQKPDVGLASLKSLIGNHTENSLLLFTGAAIAIKTSESEFAIRLLDALSSSHQGIDLHYADYLRGEVHLHKGEYPKAIAYYQIFIDHYKGQNYIKDAWYKIGICHWLNGYESGARVAFDEARKKGKDETEADKHAARNLESDELPHIQLSKARYATDGGYYQDAEAILNSITSSQIPTKKSQVEYLYRKGRLAHKQNKPTEARQFYNEVVEQAGDEYWYFAPNACLQMGYIALNEGQHDEARKFFKMALGYDKHEYKNSIDSKAKSALAQMSRK